MTITSQPGRLTTLLLPCLLWIAVATPIRGAEPIPPVSAEEVQRHIEFLASPELGGRSGRGKLLARNYILAWFGEHRLEPLFEQSYLQPIPDRTAEGEEPRIMGQNIGGFVEGTDPVLKQEWIIVNAHYDHLGIRQGRIYPGADDNASGVSMLLEVARRIARSPLKRSVAFVAFDLEESMLWGSRWFVAHPPMPSDRIKLCLTADMIGRSLGGLDLPTVFVLGAEHSTELRQALADAEIPDGLELAQLGTDLIGTRSDYGPFRDERIPFLFFSTGEHPDYHQPTDTPDRIDSPKTARISNLIHSLLITIGNAPEAPAWSDREPQKLAEAETLHRVTGHLLEEQNGSRKLSGVQRFFVSQVRVRTGFMIEQQRVSDEERQWLVRAAQLLMLSVF
jgi:hypothetical protein